MSGFSPASSADINKLTEAFHEMSASNAKLSAEVNVLKEMARHPIQMDTAPRAPVPTPPTNGVKGTQSTMNPYAGTFSPAGSGGRSRNFRAPFRCQSCTFYNVPYCLHCLKCCKEGHKAKDCPLN